MIKNVILDCDGVLADFISEAFKRLNDKTGKNIKWEEYVKLGTWHINDVFGISIEEFWDIVEGEDLWINLKPYHWAAALLEYARTIGPVTIATVPTAHPTNEAHSRCIVQKIKWLEKNFDLKGEEIMLGGRKELLARPDTLLLDDSPSNVEKFIAAGGIAVLLPSNWNTPPERLTLTRLIAIIEDTIHPLEEADAIVRSEKSGAGSSHFSDFSFGNRFEATRLTCLRFAEGNRKYENGDTVYANMNWLKAFNARDIEFFRNRAGHALEHIIKEMHGENDLAPGGNLGAIGWWLEVMAYTKKHDPEFYEMIQGIRPAA